MKSSLIWASNSVLIRFELWFCVISLGHGQLVCRGFGFCVFLLSPVHTGDKVDCFRNRRQIRNKVDYHRHGYGELCHQCVLGQSDTVDFVDFPQSQPCWIQLCHQCIPGFSHRFGCQYHYQCLVDWSVPVFGRLVSTRLWYRLGRLISEVISVKWNTIKACSLSVACSVHEWHLCHFMTILITHPST